MATDNTFNRETEAAPAIGARTVGYPAGGPEISDHSTPIQVAQAAVQIAQASASIGSVASLTGQATIIRATGETVEAAVGTPVFQDDTFETAVDSGVGLSFNDGSSFSLGSDARMTIDSFVYAGGGTDSNMVMNLAQGAFSFVSGQVAKSGENNMTIVTPTATIGIRGTAGAGDDDEVVLLQEPGQQTGELTVTTQGGTVSLTTPNSYTNTSNPFSAPTPPVPRSLGDIQSLFAGALRQLPVPLPANQNLPASNQSGDTGNGEPGSDGDGGDGETDGETAEGEGGEGGAEGEGENAEGEGEGEEAGDEEGDEEAEGEGEGEGEGDGEGAEGDTAQLGQGPDGPGLAPPPAPPPSGPPVSVAPPQPKPPIGQKPPPPQGPPPPGPIVNPIGPDPVPGPVNVIPVNANSTVTLTANSDRIEVSGANVATTVLGTLQGGDSIVDVTNSGGQSLIINDVTSHSFTVNGIESVQFGVMTGSEQHSITVNGTTPVAFNTSSGPFDASISGDGGANTVKIGNVINAQSEVSVNLGGGSDTVDINITETLVLTLTNTENITNSLGGSQEVFLTNGISNVFVDLGAGDDFLALADAPNTFSAANVESLSGGAGNDTIILTTALGSGDFYDGFDGVDRLTLASGSTNVADITDFEFINGVNGTVEHLTLEFSVNGTIFDFGNLSDGDSLQLSFGGNNIVATDIANITGGSGSDVIVYNNASSTVSIDGGGGTDTVSNGSNTVSFFSFMDIENFNGGVSANDHVTLQTLLVSGAVFSGGGTGDSDAINLAAGANTATITLFEFITGTSSNDILTLEGALGTTGVEVDLGGGLDTLGLANFTNVVTVKNIEFLNAGTGNDTVFMGTALQTGAQFDGGAGGTDTLKLLASSTNLGTISNWESVLGVTGTTESLTLEAILTTNNTVFDLGNFADNDALFLADGGNTLSVQDLKNFTGGGGDDNVTVLSPLLSGSAYDGGGSGDDSDNLILADNSTNFAVINDFEDISGNSSTGIDLTFEAGSQVNTTFTFTGIGFDKLYFNDTGSFATLNGVEAVFGGLGNDTVTVADSTGVEFTLGDGGDTATGATGVTDVFFYEAQSDANIGEGETITNFEIGVDVIDVSVLAGGNFAYIGGAAFTNGSGNLEGRFADANTVEFDVDDDGVADMEITLSNGVAASLSSGDFADDVAQV